MMHDAGSRLNLDNTEHGLTYAWAESFGPTHATQHAETRTFQKTFRAEKQEEVDALSSNTPQRDERFLIT